MKKPFKTAGIGEILWDVFPHHKRLGGAPTNFACHTGQLGAESVPVSCLGEDDLGAAARQQVIDLGMSDRYLQSNRPLPTGAVDVVLTDGKPTYQIHEHVAWDDIQLTPELNELAGQLDAVCFGSLSQRSAVSRHTIQTFVAAMPMESIRIFDVNLRQSFYSAENISASLALANVLKLSDEELPVLASFFDLQGDTETQLRQLLHFFDLKLIAYTRGPDGSLLVGESEVDDFGGCEGDAVDTVGAGDSFTAALCMGLLKEWPLKTVNRFANRVSTFVCLQHGATPLLPNELLNYNPTSEERS